MLSLLLLFSDRVTAPSLYARHKTVYAYKSSLFTPRIELKLNFFLCPRGRDGRREEKEREEEEEVAANPEGGGGGQFARSSDGKSIGYRRKSSGNPGERVVVATRKRRNEVSSRCSGSRPTLRFFERVCCDFARGNIAYRAYRTIYLRVVLLPPFFFFFYFFIAVFFSNPFSTTDEISRRCRSVLSPWAN